MEETQNTSFCPNEIDWNGDLLDEICLEGLDGIIVEQLWERLRIRWKKTVTDKLKPFLWNKIVEMKDIEMYQLPTRREFFNLQVLPEDSVGLTKANFENGDADVYPICLVKNHYGSCQFFKERVNVTETVRTLSLTEITERWDRNLVLVGSSKARWFSLAPNLSPSMYSVIPPNQYCLLERIGRSRYGGVTTYFAAKNSASTVDAKMLFYHRKLLLDFNLIKKQTIISNKPFIVLQLSRFYKNFKSSSFKRDSSLDALVEHLQKSGGVMTVSNAVHFVRNIDSSMVLKKIYKNLIYFPELQWNVPIQYKEIVSSLNDEDKNDALDENELISIVKLKEEEKDSDDENDESLSDTSYHERLFCHRERLLSQFYSCVQKAGTKGLVISEISKLMGFDRPTTVFICRILASYKLFHIILVDVKRQRKARFIAQEFAKQAMEEINEKNKANELTNSKPLIKSQPGPSNANVQNRRVGKTWSVLQKNRMNMILKFLNTEKVMYFNALPRLCTLQEKHKNGSIDKKSIKRIVNHLSDEGQLKIHYVKVPDDETVMLISKPEIPPEHDLIKSIITNRQLYQKTLVKIVPTKIGKHTSLPDQERIKSNGHLPKYWKLRSLHEYLFYLAYHHSYNANNQTTATYCNPEISEKFNNVPALKLHDNWSRGWIYLSDAVSYMPLSLFTKIQMIPYVVPGLSEMLKHPNKRHTLVKDLPLYMKSILLNKRNYIFKIFNVLEQLVLMGLAQIGERTMKEKETMYVYINKKASIFDTTSSSPSYNMTEDKEYPRELFTFETVDDVNEYWNRLQYVCLNTRLGERNKIIGKEISYIYTNVKLKSYLVSHSKLNVEEYDSGDIPGDGRGAGGLDSSFHSHLKKSWTFTFSTPSYDIKGIKVKNMKSLMSAVDKVPRKPPNLPRFITKALQIKKEKVVRKRTVQARKKIVRKEIYNDSIDEEINKNLQNLRSRWSVKETRILLLIQVAISFMCPQRSIYFPAVTRDILRIMTGIFDKTSRACARRLFYLSKKPKMVRNKQIYLAEILGCSALKNRYYNIYNLKRVMPSSPSFDEFESEMNVNLIELFYILHARIYGGNAANRTSVLLPKSYDDLQRDFSIEIPEEKIQSQSPQLADVENIQDIEEASVYSIIHSILYCSTEKNYKQENLLAVYLKHPEDVLRAALSKMRKIGSVSLRKSSSQKKLSSVTSAFNYHFSQSYIYQLCRDVPYTIFSNVHENVNNLIKSGKFESFSCNNLDVQSGTVATLIELINLKVISIDLNIPSEIKIINSKAKYDIEVDDSNDSCDVMCNDFYVIKACQFSPHLTCSTEYLRQITQIDILWMTDLAVDDAVIEIDDNIMSKKCSKFLKKKPKINSVVYKFIQEGKELGVNSSDIKNTFSTVDGLIDIIQTLLKEKLIYRVGYVKTHWISWEYANIWSVQRIKLKYDSNKRKSDTTLTEPPSKKQKKSLEQNINESETIESIADSVNDLARIFARPWIRPNGTLSHRIMWRWIGSIICHLIINSAVKLTDLQKMFNYMTPFHIRTLVEYATKFECTKMFVLKYSPESLFAESKIEKCEVTILDIDEDIYVEISPSAPLKFANMKAAAILDTAESTSSS